MWPCVLNALYLSCVSRLSSSGSSDVSNDSTANHAESYFLRRENRLSARKKAVEETENNDYKKAGAAAGMLTDTRKHKHEPHTGDRFKKTSKASLIHEGTVDINLAVSQISWQSVKLLLGLCISNQKCYLHDE